VEDLIIPSIEELFTQARDTTSNWSSLSFAAKNKIRTISHTIVDIVSSEQNSALLFKDNVRQVRIYPSKIAVNADQLAYVRS